MSEETTEVKRSDGESVNPNYLELVTLMTKWDIKKLMVDYSGSGDDGTIESPEIMDGENKVEKHKLLLKENSKEFQSLDQLCNDIICSIVNPDFNNDGSSGTATFELNDEGKLVFNCNHSEFYTTSNDTSFDEVLIDDTSLL